MAFKMALRFTWTMWLAAILLPTAVQAQIPNKGGPAIQVALVAESAVVAPGGTVTLAVAMRPSEGWHGYWKNPGDSGVETRIAWDLPEGVEVGPLRYPLPERKNVSGLVNFVHKGQYAHLVDLSLPAEAAPGTRLPIRARIDYLACTEEVCVPETANVAVDLEVGSRPGASTDRALFDRLRAALPKPLGSVARFEQAGGRLRMAIPLPAGLDLRSPYFYPSTDGALSYASDQAFSRSGDTLILETGSASAGGSLQRLEGVLKLGDGIGLSLEALPGAVPAAGTPIAPAGTVPLAGAFAIPAALFGAILGGLLLNVMPCVFPILSLKALGLAKAGGDEAGARRDSLFYSAGAIFVCLALGATMLGLRAGGESVGWAFQLQDPRAVLLLLMLTFAIALNLAGLFELPSIALGGRLAGRAGAAGAFWTGALAAFVATPCTGPFMAAALGAAIVLPAPAALAVFAGLGLGLALPFLILGFVPGARRRLPRPGPWMARFRHGLSVPMFLTALGLAWILGRQTGVDGMAVGLGTALALGLALWWLGRRQAGGRPWLPLGAAVAAAAAALLLLPFGGAGPRTASTPLAAEAFSEARLAALRAQGRPVFAYFTADWCITCKVNEKAVLEREAVSRAFASAGMSVLVGDWTGGDPAIGRFIEAQGRSGIPLYIHYPPGKPPEILPQLLTLSRVVALAQEN